jgi:ribosomal protein S27AE
MLLFDFSNIINELCDYYERREPKEGTKELWFQRVKSIPLEALPWIVKKITQENETFPKNLPGVIAALFFSWREAHPEKFTTRREVDCPDCDDGTIRAWKIGANGKTYSYLFRCGRCKQSNVQGWPAMTRFALLEAGYEPEQKEKPGRPKGSVQQAVKTLVEQFTERANAGMSPEEAPF